jgi:TolA-binding protein
MNNLDQLGKRMAEHQDRYVVDLGQEVPPPSAALGEHLLRRATERRRRRQMTLVSLTAVLVAGGTLAGLRLWPMHDHATVATVRAQAGQRIAASAIDLALAFDDGSRVVLSSGASLRTEMIGPSSASLELERGRAAVRVMHTRSTHWTVRAGAYSVLVTGTRFHLDWRPENGALSVTVEEGSVRVTGGLLAEALDISTGQSLDLEQGHAVGGTGASFSPQRTPSLASPADPVPDVAPPTFMPTPMGVELPPTQGRRPAAHRPATLASPSSSSPSSSSPASWRQQAEAGRYRDALGEAERKGFEGICRESAGADLLTLAEAARYAGHAERAVQALRAVRARFGRSEDAAVAAYLLGRIAAENHRDHAEAARWFQTYLAERPGGRLDREAEGRLLESLAFMDRNTAREAARIYLQHYPAGPHAAFARNLLGL